MVDFPAMALKLIEPIGTTARAGNPRVFFGGFPFAQKPAYVYFEIRHRQRLRVVGGAAVILVWRVCTPLVVRC